jgi:nucleotide-binding universal stress UspA family protein
MRDAPILICYDGTCEARNAIAEAALLLRARRAVVLNVGPLAPVAETYAAVGATAAGLDRDAFADAEARARQGAEFAQTAGFDAEPRAMLDAPTWHGIVEIAGEIGAAAIVVGRRARSGLRELFDEHVARDVARHAARPVLVISAGP